MCYCLINNPLSFEIQRAFNKSQRPLDINDKDTFSNLVLFQNVFKDIKKITN